MKSAPSGIQGGLLMEILGYLAALVGTLVLVVGSVVGGWDFNLLVALIILIVLFAIFRDAKALAGWKTQNEEAWSSEARISLQKVVPGGRSQLDTQQISIRQGE